MAPLVVEVFSHEVLEWLADRFVLTSPGGQVTVGSTAPRWNSPLHPPYCCKDFEVGDPVYGLKYAIGAPSAGGQLYVLEDAAMFSWFARQSPSTAVGGRYDVSRRLTDVSPSC